MNDELRRVEQLIVVVDVDTVENLEIRLEYLFRYLHHIYDRGIAPSIVTEEVLETLLSTFEFHFSYFR